MSIGCTLDVSKQQLVNLNFPPFQVFVCAWKPKSNCLASGSGDSTARIWDIGSDCMGNAAREPAVNSCIVLEHSAEIGGKNKDVTSLDWNKEGTQLGTGSYDGIARVWSDSGELQHVLQVGTYIQK